MASTYSDLKIELITTGEQSGVWGTTTNTNLGTALEEAITGSADVTFSSGNVTLTLTDTNATQVGRNLRLNLGGTTGGARDLVLPAIEKLYLINNGTADTITCKNASGTTVAVPAATSTFIYNTSTNVVDATTYLSTLSLGSALAVTSGGTGATTSGDAAFALKGANSDITSLSGLTTALTVAQGGTGAATHTANAVLIGEGASAISSVSPGTSGNVLTSDGTDWTSAAPGGGFDTGTRMIFAQNAAPTGWTKDTTNYNQHAMRIVTGTGGGTAGTVDFTSAFTSQAVAGSVAITGLSGSAGATTSGDAAFALKGANSDITSLSGLTTALTVAQGGTGAATHTANAVLIGEGASAISSVSPGTSGNVLTSDGTDWTSAAPGGGFDTGTRMIFAQNAAPTGWTKDTTNYNQHAMRIVTGTGGGTAGTVDFTSAFTSQAVAGSVAITGLSGSAGATTLSVPQIPSHTHSYTAASPGSTAGNQGRPSAAPTVSGKTTGATGGGGSHTHPFSFSSGTATFTGTAIDLAVKYLDVITATAD